MRQAGSALPGVQARVLARVHVPVHVGVCECGESPGERKWETREHTPCD